MKRVSPVNLLVMTVILLVGVYAVLMLYGVAQDMRGKRCLKWTQRYNFWTKQTNDIFPCLDWE